MSTAVTDLDVLVATDRRVKLGGREWKVPFDPPTAWLLSFQHAAERFEKSDTDADVDEVDVINELRDAVIDLFLMRQPDEEDAVVAAVDTLGLAALVLSVTVIYRTEIEEDVPGENTDEPAEGDAPHPTHGTTRKPSTSNRTKTPGAKGSSSSRSSRT